MLKKLQEQGRLDDTLIMFASDNGGCAEETKAVVFSEDPEDAGQVASFDTVGESWAIVQNTPFRYYKNYSHEGGTCTPFIACWPKGIKGGGQINAQVAHFIDIMPTLVEVGGAEYPENHHGTAITPMQGISLLPALMGGSVERGKPVLWQWDDGAAIRDGDMKAVHWGGEWELYDLSTDRNETRNHADSRPEALQYLVSQWEHWSAEVNP